MKVLVPGITLAEPELRVTDLKQYYYCPRVVYYQYVLPVDRKTTYKMEKGQVLHEELENLESRRKLKSYGLKDGKRTFNKWIRSRRLGLTGKLDLLIETESDIYPVDFKFTRGRPFMNHLYQIGGYALVLEDQTGRFPRKGFVYLIQQKDAVVFDLTDELRASCINALDEIRTMIMRERFPAAPSQRAKCTDCEYQNYCRDVW